MVWTSRDIAQAVSAKNIPAQVEVTGISFDTRTLEQGDLFVPLIGQEDGHDYIKSAIEKGAQASFWSRSLEEAPDSIAIIQVEDSHQALKDFAQSYLREIDPKVVAITGSNGKTTTKDMTASVLESSYKTYKTQGNFNNDIGLPITILNMPRNTEVLVLEMGMNHAGEISDLSKLAQPDLAVITMIGESHIEFFQGREEIARAKFEIVDGLKEGGCLFYNGDENLLVNLLETRSVKSRSFGTDSKNDLYPLKINARHAETRFTTNLNPDLELSIPLPGSYNVNNALAALSIGLALDIPLEKMKKALSAFRLTANRLQWLDGINQSRLLNDAYNASPTSMKASIESFCQLDSLGRKGLVLGEMAELGPKTLDYHRSLITAIDFEAIDFVYLYGQKMKSLYQALLDSGADRFFDLIYMESELSHLVERLKKYIQPQDQVLFKSSFSTHLISVVEELRADKGEEK